MASVFDTNLFMPHGHCYLWRPDVLWLNAVSDIVIALAYVTIPLALVSLIRRRKDLPFNWIFGLFGLFILGCGATHVMGIVTIWQPLYYLDGVIKAVTALASIGTAALIWPLIPKAVALPSPSQLASANQDLQREVAERRHAEEELRDLTLELERRVEERTREIGLLIEREKVARSDAERLYEQAQAASRMKDEFLAALSHELRTPMTAILGWTQLLMQGNLAEDDHPHAFETIERNARTQKRLIQDLLDMSAIVTGKMSLENRAVVLHQALAAAIDATKLSAEAKRVELAVETEDVGVVAGDATRLQQIVWNLLANAIKFTPEGGKVEVTLRRVAGAAELWVRDSGEGIDPAFLPFVFDRFRQADGKLTRRHGGLGLGLSIVRYLVELHGGSVAAHSAGIGHGAAFRVRLPLMAVRVPEPAAAGPSLSKEALRGISILVVDDERDVQLLLSKLLTVHGADVRVAASAREALEQIESNLPDLLISDLSMPGTSGLDLIAAIRSRSGGAAPLPAIALSAHASEADAQRALAAGFQVYLVKPVESDALLRAVAKLIGSHM